MIEVALEKSSYSPGEVINGKIILNFEKKIKTRGIYGTLLCHEKKKIVSVREMDYYDYNEDKSLGVPRSSNLRTTVQYRDDIIYREDKVIAQEGTYFKETFPFSFSLPKNAAPTSKEYGHDNKINFWELEVKVDIPFAFDKRKIIEVFVEGL
ncbi:MAG: hypothetical protein QXF35_03265 [Candidatus Bilamarchaeaceae archaeon]